MEHGWSGRYIEGWELAEKYGLKFMQGAEVYWVKNRFEKDRSNCHLYIGAMNENGRRALNDITSEAALTGMYGQCRVDVDLILSLPRDDVVVTSACVAGWKYDDAEEIMKRFSDHFGENFYLEVQYHNTDLQSRLNERILNLHHSEGIPLIMGCDSHCIDRKGELDRESFLVSKGVSYEDEEGWYLDYPDGDTAYERFARQCVLSHDEIIEAMENTNIFLKVQEYDCECFAKEIKMPNIYPAFSQQERNKKYRDVIYEAWGKEKANIPRGQWNAYEAEIEKELQVINDTNHADYFLFNEKMIKRGIERGGVLTKTGRGSAVSFYTNKLAGFTDVDRIAAKVHMYPERFMSATRILRSKSLADIDFNVADQEPFAQAQIDILGENHSYPMIAYGTLKASAAWKMYAKSQDIDFEIANEVSGQIKKYEKALKHAEEDEREHINPLDYIDEQFHAVYTKSLSYQGVIDSFSPHPCAYLIYTGDIRKEIGLVRIKGKICCCMDGKWAEEYKFLKNDLLIVSVVEHIAKAFEYAGIDIPSSNELLEMCPPNSNAWEIYKNGCTLGVNQVESGGTRHRVMNYMPTNISELCSFVAAIRPGFKSMYREFESRNHFEYGIKSFDDIIQTEDMPHSFILYQEMSMAVLNYAGIPMTECYDIIKNIAKKRVEKVLKYKEQFVSGFQNVLIEEENMPLDEAEQMSHKVWQILEDSSQYSFNASHSYCVSIDSLYGAYLKANYPLAFYKAYMEIRERKGDKDKMSRAKEEAESYFGIKFPPYKFGQDNRGLNVDYETNSIMNYLTAIKGFGAKVADACYYATLVHTESLIDILAVLDYYGVKKSKTEPLAQIDYFSSFGNSVEVASIINLFEDFSQGERKTLNKKDTRGWVGDIIETYATGVTKSGKPAARWTFTDIWGFLHEGEKIILAQGVDDVDYRVKIENQKTVLGYINFQTSNEEDRRKLIVKECYPLLSKDDKTPWAYVIITQSIGTGKKGRVTIYNNTFQKKPLSDLDIIQIKDEDLKKNKRNYWCLYDYQKIV